MTTPARRFAQPLAALALFNGLLNVWVGEGAYGDDRAPEAKKYAETLRKAKETKAKVQALQELGKIAQIQKTLVAAALPDIYKAAEDKDAGVRAAAAYCLGQCDEPTEKAVPVLVKMLKEDKADEAKIGAAKGLGAMGSGAKSAVKDLQAVGSAADKKSKLSQAVKGAVNSIRAAGK
jgi:HEAT repeat protein